MSYLSHQVESSRQSVDARADFIRKTYLHLGGAVIAFVLLTAALIQSPIAPAMLDMLSGSRFMWLIVLGAFMVVGTIAERWAMNSSSLGMQYAGLALYVVAEAIIFVPLMFIAAYYSDPSVIPTAGILTGAVFGGLTLTVLFTKKDFSFLQRFLMIGTFAAMGFILVAILFGITLGSFFSLAMVLLMSGWILYQTSNVVHHYPVGAHVAAALALFASFATLFWYILQLVMSFAGDD
ncbi:MAG: Bax inhibitor-1 family protein [Bradymonadia bacterium]